MGPARLTTWTAGLAACLSAAQPARTEPAAASRYTKVGFGQPGCRSAQPPVEGLTCAGLDGWRVLVGYPAIGASVEINRPGRPEMNPTDGRSLAIEGLNAAVASVEWRGGIRGGRFAPRAAILRVVVLDPGQREEMIETGQPPAQPRRAQVLLVHRLTPEGACRIAYVDAGANPDANDLARSAADAPGGCPAARVGVQGRSSPILDANVR